MAVLNGGVNVMESDDVPLVLLIQAKVQVVVAT
jgi:hypothetical protein